MSKLPLRVLAASMLLLAMAAAQATDPSGNLFLSKARALGYRPEKKDGKDLYCRTYQQVGSHLYTHECLSEADLLSKLALDRPTPDMRVVSPSASSH